MVLGKKWIKRGYFYPRPPRGGRQRCGSAYAPAGDISIHALREEGDVVSLKLCGLVEISIHALREEGDAAHPDVFVDDPEFLSTPSARRATPSARPQACRPTYFYPRPPRGGRPKCSPKRRTRSSFLSTPSARRATRRIRQSTNAVYISIHALREEGDSMDPRPLRP